jgi:hypothetical protein
LAYTYDLVYAFTLPNKTTIEIEPNEEPDENHSTFENLDSNGFTDDELRISMTKEFESLKDFEVFKEIPISECSEDEIRNAYSYTWVHRRKPTEVRSRLCIQGQYQPISDRDDTYASTPIMVILRILLTMALARSWSIKTLDISTAFLHATVVSTDGERILMKPPSEFYPNSDVLWWIQKAMYGLRTSPKDWQQHFAATLLELLFVRLQSDANVYVQKTCLVFILAYVDDLLLIGPFEHVERTMNLLKQRFLLKPTGTLDDDGSRINFLGRRLQRSADGILISGTIDYYHDEMEFFDVVRAKASPVPSSTGLKRPHDGDEPVTD